MSNPKKFAAAAAATFMLAFSIVAQTGKPAPATVAPTPVASTPASTSDRERDGLNGPVRRIKTEVAKLNTKTGKPVEGPRVTLETAAYDVKGIKTETAYFPVAGSTLTGRESYKYDDQGNISEMTLYNTDGTLMAKEVYKYDYDFVGNWTSMTTSVAVIEGGKINYDPVEVSHRTIAYYLDEKLTKMMEAAQKPAASPATATTNPAAPGTVAANTSQPVASPKPTSSPVTNTPDNSGSGNVAANHVVDPKTTEVKTPPAGAPLNSSVTGQPSSVKPADTNAGTTDAKTNSTTPATTEPEPVKPAPKPFNKPISGGVLNGAALSLPAPKYPEMAQRARASGLVTVEVVIDEEGKVIAAKATNGPSILFAAAVEAAKRARFTPTKLSGLPVKVTGTINYNFSLAN
ncbi:MAG: TonB family protein [Pyrinomonadaceae bacterium]